MIKLENDWKHTEARGELIISEVSIAIRVKGIEYVLQLLLTKGKLTIQSLVNKTENTAAIWKNKLSRSLTVLYCN